MNEINGIEKLEVLPEASDDKVEESSSSAIEEVEKTMQVMKDSNKDVVSVISRTNELLTMSLYLYLIFFVFFALHRFSQAKRRK